MAGANFNHNQITDNLSLVFGIEFREKSCNVITSDMRVQVSETGPIPTPMRFSFAANGNGWTRRTQHY